jgi:hypothetical protein
LLEEFNHPSLSLSLSLSALPPSHKQLCSLFRYLLQFLFLVKHTKKGREKKSTSKTKEPRIPNKQMLTKEKKPPATMPVVGLCEFYFVMELGTSLFFLLCQK